MNPGQRRQVRISIGVGWWAGMTVLATLAIVQVSPASAAAARRPNLQGSWSFNPLLTSQIAKDEQGESRGEGPGESGKGHRQRGAGEGGGGGGGSRGGRQPDDGKATRGGDVTESAEDGGEAGQEHHAGAALDALTIAQDGDQITITNNWGRARVVKADGKKLRSEPAKGRGFEQKASWDEDGALRIEIKPDKGDRRTESYLVSNDGKHLYLTVTGAGGARPGRETIRAYDRAEPQPAAPEAPASPTPPPSRPPFRP